MLRFFFCVYIYDVAMLLVLPAQAGAHARITWCEFGRVVLCIFERSSNVVKVFFYFVASSALLAMAMLSALFTCLHHRRHLCVYCAGGEVGSEVNPAGAI